LSPPTPTRQWISSPPPPGVLFEISSSSNWRLGASHLGILSHIPCGTSCCLVYAKPFFSPLLLAPLSQCRLPRGLLYVWRADPPLFWRALLHFGRLFPPFFSNRHFYDIYLANDRFGSYSQSVITLSRRLPLFFLHFKSVACICLEFKYLGTLNLGTGIRDTYCIAITCPGLSPLRIQGFRDSMGLIRTTSSSQGWDLLHSPPPISQPFSGWYSNTFFAVSYGGYWTVDLFFVRCVRPPLFFFVDPVGFLSLPSCIDAIKLDFYRSS